MAETEVIGKEDAESLRQACLSGEYVPFKTAALICKISFSSLERLISQGRISVTRVVSGRKTLQRFFKMSDLTEIAVARVRFEQSSREESAFLGKTGQ